MSDFFNQLALRVQQPETTVQPRPVSLFEATRPSDFEARDAGFPWGDVEAGVGPAPVESPAARRVRQPEVAASRRPASAPVGPLPEERMAGRLSETDSPRPKAARAVEGPPVRAIARRKPVLDAAPSEPVSVEKASVRRTKKLAASVDNSESALRVPAGIEGRPENRMDENSEEARLLGDPTGRLLPRTDFAAAPRDGRPGETAPQVAARLPAERRSDPPAIQVTIGRVEIRASTPPAPSRKPSPKSEAMSLEDYLKQHGGERR